MFNRLLVTLTLVGSLFYSGVSAQCSWNLEFVGAPIVSGSTYSIGFQCASGSDPRVAGSPANGTIDWNSSRIINIPCSVDVTITGTLNGCAQSKTYQSPCKTGGCTNPSLGLGTPTCTSQGANTYYVSYNAEAGSIVSCPQGTVDASNNRVTGIAIGTNAVITASKSTCQTQQTAYSPANCSSPPPPTVDLTNISGFVGVNVSNTGQSLADGLQYRLAVKGRVLAEEVRVRTGWADYVFDASYKLLPLPSVERYINAYKHLPGIPSAREVQASGIDLGLSQTLLLQKIEELTLYVIAQQKRIERLEKQRKRVHRH